MRNPCQKRGSDAMSVVGESRYSMRWCWTETEDDVQEVRGTRGCLIGLGLATPRMRLRIGLEWSDRIRYRASEPEDWVYLLLHPPITIPTYSFLQLPHIRTLSSLQAHSALTSIMLLSREELSRLSVMDRK